MNDITKQIKDEDDFYTAEETQVQETVEPAKYGRDYTKVFKVGDKFYAFEYNVHDGISWHDAPFMVYQVTPQTTTITEYVKV